MRERSLQDFSRRVRSGGQDLEKLFSQNVSVDNNLQRGDNVKDQSNASLFEGTVVEDEAFLGPSCVLTNVTNPRSQVVRHGLYERTPLKRG